MSCGHFICPNDLLLNVQAQIDLNKHKITCALCSVILPLSEIFRFVTISEDKKASITKAISTNLSISEGKVQCPSCKSYCERQNNSQVKCSTCTHGSYYYFPYIFCSYCCEKWKDPSDLQNCGNKDCSRNEMYVVTHPPMTHFTGAGGKLVEVPTIRMCPKCATVIEHKGGCSQMRCWICGFNFCLICLRELSRNGGLCTTATYNISITCNLAPIQKV